MIRNFLSFLVMTVTVGLSAQEKATPRIEKSAPVELVNPDAKPTSIAPPTAVTIQGDHDTPPAPQACKEKSGQVLLDCISREVLTAIRAKMNPADATSGPHAYPVIVMFQVNQYGEMDDVRVEHTGSADLPKKVIVAVYGLPTFVPASKGGVAVGTNVTVTYPFEALFAKD